MLSRFRRHALLHLTLLLLAGAPGPVQADAPPGYRGRPLVEVLDELRAGGLELIFSSAVVASDVIVSVEPTATDPRLVLEEILGPLGLEIGDGPGNSLLILPLRPKFGRVSGQVVSTHATLPIRRASIRVAGSDVETRSGRDGTFELNRVPVGTHEVIVQAFGFETRAATVQIRSGEETKLHLTLGDRQSFSTEIVVTPSRRFILQHEQTPGRVVDRTDALLVPSIGGDITRVVELLPGVSASDNSAAFHVRGSLQDDVAIVLDGLELYDPFHLRSFQSPFSLIDGQIVQQFDVVSGGFTVDRGDRHGGFLDISTIEPEQHAQGSLTVGTLNSRASYGGQLNNRSAPSWLFSVRGWYPEAEHEVIKLGGGGRLDPRFYDAYSKVSFVVSPRVLVSAHSLLAFDRIEFAGRAPEGQAARETADALTRNAYFWLRVRNIWTTAITSESVFSGGRIERRRGGVSATGADTAVRVQDDRAYGFLGFKHDSTWQMSNSRALRAGLDVRRLDARYRYSRLALGGSSPPDTTAIDPEGDSIGLYVAHRARVSSSLATEAGVRWDRQSYADQHQFSPRLNAAWLPNERSELLLAVGRFSQSQRIHELRVEDGETSFLPAESSNQAELTLKHRFPRGLRLRIDAFYRELSRLRPRNENLFQPIELFPETHGDRVRIAPSRARLQGLEIMLQSASEQPLTWWISYARNATEDIIDGESVPRTWDEPHAVKFLVGHRWGGRWIAALSGTAHTGWPTTPLTGAITTAPGGPRQVERILGRRNSDRFAPYARLDAKLSGAFALPRGRLALTVEVLNLTDRENACCIDEFELSPREDGSVDVERELDYWLGFTPSLSLTWEF